jgi:hypothetical protein
MISSKNNHKAGAKMSHSGTFIHSCDHCHSNNRISLIKMLNQRPKCGKCGTFLLDESDEAIVFCLIDLLIYKSQLEADVDHETSYEELLDLWHPERLHTTLSEQVLFLQHSFKNELPKTLQKHLDKLVRLSYQCSKEIYKPYYALVDIHNEGDLDQFMKGAASREGAAGAAIGAAIGSIIPGFGTVIGAAIGGAIGGSTLGNQRERKINRHWEELGLSMDHYFAEIFNYYDDNIAEELTLLLESQKIHKKSFSYS